MLILIYIVAGHFFFVCSRWLVFWSPRLFCKVVSSRWQCTSTLYCHHPLLWNEETLWMVGFYCDYLDYISWQSEWIHILDLFYFYVYVLQFLNVLICSAPFVRRGWHPLATFVFLYYLSISPIFEHAPFCFFFNVFCRLLMKPLWPWTLCINNAE